MNNDIHEYSTITNNRNHIINTLMYFASNYLCILFLVPIYLGFKFTPRYQDVPIIKSFKRSEQWNSLYDPHIFGFISDPHITPFFPDSEVSTSSILKIFNETGVEKILVAGDIGDNFATKSSIKHGQQYEPDYITYKKMVQKYPSDFLIVASGNHDEFGVESYNSPDHYILKYCDFYSKNEKYQKYENFLISKVDYDDIEIFVMNLYHYPTVRAGLGYFSNLTREMLDIIESTLSKPSQSKARLLITHFPLTYTNTWAKSSHHKTLIDIVTSSRITAVLAGHSHHELVLHRKTSLEIRPCSIKGGKDSGGGYRYISIDNSGLNDHGFVLNKGDPVAVMTYPIQKNYVNDQTDFSVENFKQAEIRVVHFSERSDLNISVSCGEQKENLVFQRVIRTNQALYSIPITKVCSGEKIGHSTEASEFHLTFSGDWKHEADFVVGDQVKLKREILDYDVNMRKFIITIGAICWVVIFYIWCPFPSFHYFDRVSEMIAGRKTPKLSNNGHHHRHPNLCDEFVGAIFGFFVVKSRIYNNIPRRIQWIYFVLVLSPFYLPICLMKIGKNSYGFIHFLGYYLNGFAFDLWGGQLISYFVIFVLVPSTIVFSAISFMKQTERWNYAFIIDIALAILQFALVVIPITKALYQSTSLLFALSSPFFVFIPLGIISIQILTFMKFWKTVCTAINNIDDRRLSYNNFEYY